MQPYYTDRCSLRGGCRARSVEVNDTHRLSTKITCPPSFFARVFSSNSNPPTRYRYLATRKQCAGVNIRRSTEANRYFDLPSMYAGRKKCGRLVVCYARCNSRSSVLEFLIEEVKHPPLRFDRAAYPLLGARGLVSNVIFVYACRLSVSEANKYLPLFLRCGF